jgi:hypothetical protein
MDDDLAARSEASGSRARREMMHGHITYADLRAYFDHELPAERQAQTQQHLAGCPDCRVRLEAVSERARLVAGKLAVLEPQAQEGPRPAGVAMAQVKQQQRKDKVAMAKTIFNKRPLWAGLAGVLVLALAFSLAPVQAWAGNFLGLFRVQQVQVLPIDTTQLSSLSNDSSLVKSISQLFSDSVTVTREPGQPVVVASAAEASQAAGFSVRLLSAGEGTPRLTVQDGTAFNVVLNRQRAQSLLDAAGRSDLQLPASIDGETISVDVPKGVTAAYGSCPTPATSDNGPAPDRNLSLGRSGNCVLFAQLPSPSVNTPPDLNIGQLAEIGLQFTGMSAAEAHQFSQSVDWTSTLVIPFPSNAGSYQQVSVDGVSGTLISRNEHGGQYSLIWVKNGILYGLTGSGTSAQAISLAQSIQ